MDGYKVNPDECICCLMCKDGCPVGAISEDNGVAKINEDQCIGCGACADTCPVGAISSR